MLSMSFVSFAAEVSVLTSSSDTLHKVELRFLTLPAPIGGCMSREAAQRRLRRAAKGQRVRSAGTWNGALYLRDTYINITY